MNKLEELFKEKLSDYAMVTPNRTWEKVEAGLSKKSKTIIWLRWAAIFLIGCFLLGSLWLQRQDNSSTLAKESQPVSKDEVSIQKSVPPIFIEQKSVAKNARRRKENKVNPAPTLLQSVAASEKAPGMEVPSPAPTQDGEIPAPEITKLSSPISHGIVLTYTLSPVELPIADAAAISEADADGKKDKSLKRMVDFAMNVKNSDSPLGGIRVMKEDLFALELKKKTTIKNH